MTFLDRITRRGIRSGRAGPGVLMAAALMAMAVGLHAASPFDILNRVRETVEKAVPDAPAPAAEKATAATSTSDADAASSELLVQALLADSLTPEQEAQIGSRIAGNLLGAAPLIDDMAAQQYVNRVGMLVAAQSGRPELPWRFGIIASNDINAFAAPGGFVFVTAGLYRLFDNEAELAAVLAHEIGHVVRRHHLAVMKKSSLIGAVSSAISNRLSGDQATLQSLLGNGAEILARGLDKDAEFEADRLGVVFAARAGYDPYAMFGVLEKVAAAASTDAGPVALLYKTHPHPDARIEALAGSVDGHLDAVPAGGTLAERMARLPPG